MVKHSGQHRYLDKGNVLRYVLYLYILLLLLSIILSCFFSYRQKSEELQSQIDSVFTQLSSEYEKITSTVWQLYMPFFENSSLPQDILQQYMTNNDTAFSPIEQKQLEQLMRQMLLRDQNVMWIVLYNSNRSDNYILYADIPGLKPLTEDFPLMEELIANTGTMAIYQPTRTEGYPKMHDTMAICGGFPYYIESGKLLIGYSTAPFESICRSSPCKLDSLSFVLTNNDDVLFAYHGPRSIRVDNLSLLTDEKQQYTDNHKLLRTNSRICGIRSSRITYYVLWQEFFLYCHKNTPLLITLFLVFFLISMVVYAYILRRIAKEVSIIQTGLNEISENNLTYRITSQFQQGDLSQIASSINEMAERLHHNINLAYYYEIKQREAELSELQSKFNPHFLYNTLEMLRSRCQQNNDDTSAKLITDLSTIFRGFISSTNFVPMSEELSFSKRYLSLFSARYGDRVEIRYDFDRDILNYGIIKNVFQPLIENYFIHGFDTGNDENYILLKGRSLDEKTMLITVEDNGIGMTPEDMEKLNAELSESIQINTESYGLKNLHQRLHLFYGGNCGLSLHPNANAPKGISIQIIASKMTCEEYEAMRIKKPTFDPNIKI